MTVASAGSPVSPGRRGAAILVRLVPAGLTLAVLGIYLLDGLVWHPGDTRLGCPTGVVRLAHWDGAWYGYIALHGYRPIPGSVQQPSAFFPLFPGLAVAVHAMLPMLSLVGAGILLNVVLTMAAMTLVDRVVASWPGWHRAGLVLLLLVLPGAFFYATFYTEAIFAFALALLMWSLSGPRRLWWAVPAIAVASADRLVGVAFVAALLGVLWMRRRQVSLPRAAALVVGSLAGIAGVVVYSAVSAGSLTALVDARRGFRGFGGDGYIPYTVRHGLANTVTIIGQEARAARVPAAVDPVISAGGLAMALGLYMDILLVPLTVAAWRWRRALGIVAAVLLAVTLLVGSPISQVRYAMVILPAWMAGVALLRGRRAGWAVLGLVAAGGLVANLVLMGRFAGCQWAG